MSNTNSVLLARSVAHIRIEMNRKDWSQTDLAEAIGCRPSYVSDILAGRKRPGYGVIEKIAGALEIDPGKFYQPVREKISA